jgi:DNA-binding Lrp family transcriptional regulator
LDPTPSLEEMVTAAYVLIQTEIGKPPQVAAALRSIPGLGTVDLVTGPYDIILRVEAEDIDAVGKLVVGAVQGVEGVVRTLTCPVVHL